MTPSTSQGFEVHIEVPVTVPEATLWRAEVRGDLAWTVTPTPGTDAEVLIPAATSGAILSAEVTVAPATACSPTWLVLDARFEDVARVEATVHHRLYYQRVADTLQPASAAAYYAARRAWIAANGSAETFNCHQAVSAAAPSFTSPVVAGLATTATDGGSGSARDGGRGWAQSQGQCGGLVSCHPDSHDRNTTVSGVVAFWDSRDYTAEPGLDDSDGARLPACNPETKDCVPDSEDCCWRTLPRAAIEIYFGYVGDPPISSHTDELGRFCVEYAGNARAIATKARVFPSRRGGAFFSDTSPGDFSVRRGPNRDWSTDIMLTGSHPGDSDVGVLHLNSPKDATSEKGDWATIFRAGFEAQCALVIEGETRHQLNAAPGVHASRLDVIYPADATTSVCTHDPEHHTDTVYVSPSDAREPELLHTLGLMFLSRIVGCDADGHAEYPRYLGGGYGFFPDYYTTEGNALRLGLASLIVSLATWDPQTAHTPDIFASLYDCRVNGDPNANNASDERNNWHALWELLDADRHNTNGWFLDLIDINATAIFQGVIDLRDQPGERGEDNTNNERVMIDAGTSCAAPQDCQPDEACSEHICWRGDPHGENIEDLVYHIARRQPGSLSDYQQTLASSPCLGGVDDTYPYQDYPIAGGFREQ